MTNGAQLPASGPPGEATEDLGLTSRQQAIAAFTAVGQLPQLREALTDGLCDRMIQRPNQLTGAGSTGRPTTPRSRARPDLPRTPRLRRRLLLGPR